MSRWRIRKCAVYRILWDVPGQDGLPFTLPPVTLKRDYFDMMTPWFWPSRAREWRQAHPDLPRTSRVY